MCGKTNTTKWRITQVNIRLYLNFYIPKLMKWYFFSTTIYPKVDGSTAYLKSLLQLCFEFLMYKIINIKAKTYGGDMMFPSFRLVLGCFCIISSCPSNVLRYWICCGEGTGIRLGSLTTPLVGVVEQDVVDVLMFCFCCAMDWSVRPNIPSTGNIVI